MVMTVEKQTAYRLYRYVPGRDEFLRTFRRVERAVKPFGKALPVALRRVGPPNPAFMVLRNLDLIYAVASELMPDRPVALGDQLVEVPDVDAWSDSDPLPFDLAGWYHYQDHDYPWVLQPSDWQYLGENVTRFSGPALSPRGVDNVLGAAPWGTFSWNARVSNPAQVGTPLPDAWYIGHYFKYDHDPASPDPDAPWLHPAEEFWWVNEAQNGPIVWTGPTKEISVPGAIVLPPWRQMDPNRQRAVQPDMTVRHEVVRVPSLERIVEVVPATQPLPQPLPQPTKRAPVQAGEKERKVMPRSRRLGIALVRILDKLSESAEVVDAVFEALPKDVQRRWKRGRRERPLADQAGQYGVDGADWKLQAIWHNWHKIDPALAVHNIVANEIEDRVYGGIYRGLPKNVGRALDPSFKGLNDLLSEVL